MSDAASESTEQAAEGLVTASAAAAELGVSVDTVRRWSKLGLIKDTRDARNRRLFSRAELERLHRKLNGEGESQYRVLESGELFDGATCIDLFAGGGGTALGFHNAGLKHVYLNELDRDAATTLVHNSETHGLGWNVDNRDVCEVDFADMQAEVIQAGFPCQAFSYAGKSRGFEDTRGTLFFEFARAIRDVRPKIAIGENVRGLVRHDGGRTLATMLETLDQLGYRVRYRVLRSQYLDVPQKRERLIMFAVRRDLDLPFIFPRERDYFITLREALRDCPASPGQEYPEKKRRVMEQVPAGGYWRDLPEEVQKEYMGGSYYLTGGRTGMARRLSWDEPSLTLTCAPAQKQTERCHPEETRPLTVREYARIQTFPDDWEFCGSMAHQYKQIGNAVPVNLGYHVGRCVLAALGYISADDGMDVIWPEAGE